MDKETFANHISKLGKRDFDIACNFVLHEIFSLIAVNVDGRGDGGTDFTSFNSDGSRMLVAYQITTQKSDIKNKAYNDAKKSLNKLGVNRFFFITTYMLSEAETRSLENDISIDLNIAATVYTPATLADLIKNPIVIKNNSGREIRATYIPTDAVLVQDTSVETSGLGGIYPKGIHVGTIKEVVNTKNPTDKYATIETAVDFSKLDTVLVILN